jgi:hypothetical protein
MKFVDLVFGDQPLLRAQQKQVCQNDITEVTPRYYVGGDESFWDESSQTTLDNQNAQILAHAIPSRTHALGQFTMSGGNFIENVNSQLDFGSSNQGHSAQFYDSYAVRQRYWRQILVSSVELNPNNYSKLAIFE